ncbi:MAG: cyclodeaminase/cyclohydrolase family protein [Halodesulfurarchaeum sp.]
MYDDVLEAVASDRVAPASGTVVAVTAASGTALAEMAVTHSRDHHDPQGARSQRLADARSTLRGHRAVLLSLAVADAGVVDRLFGGGYSSTPERERRRATAVPLSTAEAAVDALTLVAELGSVIARTVRTDLRAGVGILGSAALVSADTARENLEAFGSDGVAQTCRSRLEAVETAIATTLARLEAALDFEIQVCYRG